MLECECIHTFKYNLSMKRHKSTKPQQVLVTGGLGFIGKHLCVKLLSLGYTVTSLDNESASSEDALDFILDG